jgi:hypothetical protein
VISISSYLAHQRLFRRIKKNSILYSRVANIMSMVEVLLRKAISSTVHIALASDRQTPSVMIILCLRLCTLLT